MTDTKVWSRDFRMNDRNMDWDPARNKEELQKEQAAERETFVEEQATEELHLRHANRLHAEIRENRGDQQDHGVVD